MSESADLDRYATLAEKLTPDSMADSQDVLLCCIVPLFNQMLLSTPVSGVANASLNFQELCTGFKMKASKTDVVLLD